jgi:UDP-N-acetylmuramate--alanine ligase
MIISQKHIHFVGIGGAGMSGIAEVLLRDGYQVSGSDLSESEVTARLQKFGAIVYLGHHADHISHADVVVASTAISSQNPEIQAAKLQGIPVLKRAEMLSEIMRTRYGIAVAGTHGKTTTTSLLASILTEAGLDPTFIIGGKLKSAQAHGRLGSGEYLVAEADESDASFLYLYPEISIVTSISPDHLVNYDHDFDNLKRAFVQFIQQLPPTGIAVMCIDEPHVVEIIPEISRQIITYGFSEPSDHGITSKEHVHIINLHQEGTEMMFDVKRSEKPLLSVRLSLPGMHNVLNATAAITVASYLNVTDTAIISALEQFQGVHRRFEIMGELSVAGRHVVMVDDYGHHPHEIEMTIDAARKTWPDKKIAMVFQPHRYTRTYDLFDEFIEVLQQVDDLYLLPIYAASETPIPGVTSEVIAERLKKVGRNVILLSHIDEAESHFSKTLPDNVVLLMQGAGGDVAKLVEQVVRDFGVVINK